MGYVQVAPHYLFAVSIRIRTADGSTSDFQRYMIEWQLFDPRTNHVWLAWMASPQTCFLGSDENERGAILACSQNLTFEWVINPWRASRSSLSQYRGMVLDTTLALCHREQ